MPETLTACINISINDLAKKIAGEKKSNLIHHFSIIANSMPASEWMLTCFYYKKTTSKTVVIEGKICAWISPVQTQILSTRKSGKIAL